MRQHQGVRRAGVRGLRRSTLLGVTLATALAGACAAGAVASGSERPASSSSGGSTSPNCHGCGKGKTIKVAIASVGTPAQLSSWEHYVAALFKKETGAKVSYSVYTTAEEQLNQIETGATTHIGPDVMNLDNAYIGSANSAGIFNPISSADWALAGGKSNFTKAALAKDLTGGDTIPWYLSEDLMLYNTKLFKEAGISQPPKSWAAYVKDASLITKLGNGTYGAPLDPTETYDPWHTLYSLTRDMGGNFINSSGTKATMTSPAVVKAFKFWFSWYKDGIASPQSMTESAPQLLAAFQQNKLGFLNQSVPANAASLAGTPAAHNWAWAPMPTLPVGYKALPKGAPKHGFESLVFGYVFGVPNWSHEQSLAYRFIRAATSRQAEVLFNKYTFELPTTKAATAIASKLPGEAAFLKYESVAAPAPPVPYWGTVEIAVSTASTTLARDVQNGTYNNSALMAALQKADAQIDGAIATSKG